MALARIKKGDVVKIISGIYKGKVATVNGFKGANGVLINGIGERKRHAAANRYMPAGKRDIQLPIHISNVALIGDEKLKKTSRVGYATKPDGTKSRILRQMKNKEVK